MTGPCLCGDLYCGSCGPAQGNSRCPSCGRWSSDGPCDDPDKCEAEARAAVEAEIAEHAEAERLERLLRKREP